VFQVFEDMGRWVRDGKLLLLIALVGCLLLKGLLPAFTAITDDFPEYFTSAKSIRDGQDAVKLYDGAWFRQRTRLYGVGPPDNPGEFAPYPPPTALFLMPLTDLRPLTALRVVTTMNVVCLICSAFLLSGIFGWRLIDSALFIVLAGWALHSGLRFGHPYILISTLCLLGYRLYLKGSPWLAGLCFGVFIPVKYYPLVVLLAFALHGQWRVVLGGAIAAAAVTLLSIAVLGWTVHGIFITDVLWNHLSGHLVPGPRFTAVFQSFDTLFERLFILDPVRNPHPWLSAPAAATAAMVIAKSLLVLAAAAALIRLAPAATTRAIAPTIGILGILVLLIAPGTGTYAFVLLWLPVALLIDYFLSARARLPAYLVLFTYALIGFIPYGHTYRFEGNGALTLLAYPRLFLVLAMFIVCIYVVSRSSTDRPSRLVCPEVQSV
jgi:hypothetical protein